MIRKALWVLGIIGLAVAMAAGAQAQQLDPDNPAYDPDQQFVITPFGAILGDPAQLTDLATGRTGFTHASTVADKDRGLLVMASLIIPAQDGAEGGGHAMMLTVDRARDFIAFLRKGPDWAKVAADNKVGLFSKPIGDVIGTEGESEHLSIVFVSDEQSRGAIRIEHVLGGVTKAYRFGVNAALKYATQTEHALETALAQNPEAAPAEDAEKSKLFE